MNRTIFGLAFLKSNWDDNKKDIIDSYVPLVCSCITAKNHTQVDRDRLKKDFNDIYGLDIPLGAIESILKRMVKNQFLKKETGVYKVISQNVNRQQSKITDNQIEKEYNDVIEDIVGYSKKKFDIDYNSKDIEDGILAFLREFDLDIMLASEKVESVFSKIKEDKKIKYIISKYIIHIQEYNSKYFKRIIDIAKGHAIAVLITFDSIKNYTGNLNNIDIYVDAPIVFNLLGINGKSNLSLANELVIELKKNGAKLKIFEINNEEVVSTISDAIERLKTGNFELYKSSRVLRTAIRESYSASALQIKLNQLSDIYDKFNIQIIPSPDLEDVKYEIDHKKLAEIIEDIYTQNGKKNLPFYKRTQIENDVETISYIYRIRENASIISLKNCKAVLLTSNESIAFASKHNEIHNSKVKPAIPPCLTDIFLATILWSNYPSKSDNLNIKRLISECYANTELDNKLLQRFYSDIEKMYQEHRISDEQFYLLNSSNLTYKLLEQLTLNDIEEYTDRTPAEVVEETINILKHGEIVINKNVKKISHRIGTVMFWTIILILIALSIFSRYISPSLSGSLLEKIFWVVSALLGCFGFFRWGNKIPPREYVVSFFSNAVYRFIMGFLQKEDDE